MSNARRYPPGLEYDQRSEEWGPFNHRRVVYLVLLFALVLNPLWGTRHFGIYVPRYFFWGVCMGVGVYGVALVNRYRAMRLAMLRWRFVPYYTILIGMSFVYLWAVWGQRPDQTIRNIGPNILCWLWLVFYHKQYTTRELFAALTVFTLIYAIIYAYVYNFNDHLYGGDLDIDIDAARGLKRLTKPPGYFLCFLSGLWGLNLFLLYRRPLHLVLFAVGLTLAVFSVVRQLIVSYFVVSLLLVLYRQPWWRKLLVMGLCYAVFTFFVVDSAVYQSLTEITEKQSESSDGFKEDVRARAYRIYFFEYGQSPYTVLFGHGPSQTSSPYGKYAESWGVTTADVGYASLYVKFGIIGMLLYFWVLIKVLRMPVPFSCYWAKMFFLLMALLNVLSNAWESGWQYLAIAMYVLDMGRGDWPMSPSARRRPPRAVGDASLGGSQWPRRRD